ncbi:hydantoinase [Gammaproteobacteria bacterium 42_54_T18]|nr:hydantoinase [Gammaproteobacteria bacterium 42_54_T18]
MMSLGVDTGGTFTDFVLLDNGSLRIHKVLSTPSAPEQAILQGITDMGLMDAATSGQLRITHGSTVATNAALENKGVKTAFVTNKGFADILTIGRQARAELYNLQPNPTLIPVDKALCFETGGRLDANGQETSPLNKTDINILIDAIKAAKPDAIAICQLFSYLNPATEKAIEAALTPLAYVSRSSEVLPTSGEYERGIATWLNASLGPLVKRYVDQLRQALHPANIAVMQSTGGTIDAKQAADHAVNMLLSGPAGGLSGARFMGKASNTANLLTFDMGGTSTDVATIQGHIKLTTEGHIGPWPVAVPQVDMHTIGAGGGSIAYIDDGGLLQVGPESAGAYPGPACYKRTTNNEQSSKPIQPTVTDANVILGRLRPELFLGGNMTLDVSAAQQALQPLAKKLNLNLTDIAQGIIDIANDHMASALRVISVQRGVDIQQFHLCSFGGAGGLHVCALADALQMEKALVPIHGGVLSAFGMLTSVKERQLSQAISGIIPSHINNNTNAQLSPEKIQQHCDLLISEGTKALLLEGIDKTSITTTCSLDLRYQGQSFFLNVPWMKYEIEHGKGALASIAQAFHQQHRHRYGHALSIDIELVNVRIALTGQQPSIELPVIPTQPEAKPTITAEGDHIYQRADLVAGQMIHGPALIAETVSTTYIDNSWCGYIDPVGNILLTKSATPP